MNRIDPNLLLRLLLEPPQDGTVFPWADTTDVTGGAGTEVTVDTSLLGERRDRLYQDARALLWDPKDPSGRGIFAIGMEGGQYQQPLAALLAFAKKIGCQTIQASLNHIDLARCATDRQYRAWVRAIFMKNELPLLSVSCHILFYILFACRSNPKGAAKFIPADCQGTTPEETQNFIINKICLVFRGAAELGLEVLHLFMGKPDAIGEYLWPPHDAADLASMENEFVHVLKPLIALARSLGLKLAEENHFGTIACNSADFIRVWKKLDAADVWGIGEDMSHRWHGALWPQEMTMLADAGVETYTAHAKNMVQLPGYPMLGHDVNHLRRGLHFAPLSAPSGMVDMELYMGQLAMTSTLTQFWGKRGLPASLNVEAEYPGRRIDAVTERGVNHLLAIIGPLGWHYPDGDFTDAMKAK